MCICAMEIKAKVFKNGNSLAVRLPSALKVRAKEFSIELGRDGDIVLYDPAVRERAWKRRLKRLDEMIQKNRAEEEAAIAAGARDEDFNFPRFE